MTKITGEISKPPKLGMIFRIGLSGGSVIRYKNRIKVKTN